MLPPIRSLQLTDPTQPYGPNATTPFALLKGQSEKLLSTIFRLCIWQDFKPRLSLVCKKWAIERRQQCLLRRISLGKCRRTHLQYTRPPNTSFVPHLLADGKIGFYRGANGRPVSAPLSFPDEFVVYDTLSQAILWTHVVGNPSNWSIRPNENILYRGIQGSVWESSLYTNAQGRKLLSHPGKVETRVWAKDSQRLFVMTEEKKISIWNPLGRTRTSLLCFYRSKDKPEILKYPENENYCCPTGYEFCSLGFQVDQNHVWVSFVDESGKRFKLHWVANQKGEFFYKATPPEVPFQCCHHENYTITDTIRDENNQIVLGNLESHAVGPGYIFCYTPTNDTLHAINTATKHTASYPLTPFRNGDGFPAKVRLTYLRDSYLLIEEDHKSSETRNFGIFDFIQGKFTSRQTIGGHISYICDSFFNGEQLLVWLGGGHLELFDFTDRQSDLTQPMKFQFIRETTKTHLKPIKIAAHQDLPLTVTALRKRRGFSTIE